VRYLPEPENLAVARSLVENTRPFANALGVNRCEIYLSAREGQQKK
jgi:hypothetical protein